MTLQQEVDAMLKYFEATASPTIIVNKDTAPVRQRFSVAHELGHLILNKRQHPEGGFVESDVFYRDQNSRTADNPTEIFANQFGAALLMPAQFVRTLVGQGKSDLVMAHDFGVSLSALTHRLSNLRLTPQSA